MTGFKAILPAHGSRHDPPRSGLVNSTIQSHINGDGVTDNLPKKEEAKPKRKRTVQGKVATIACLECRRTRSKCDGEPGSACARCRTRNSRCVYQPHTKIQKDEILSDLEQERARTESLAQRNHELSTILQAISNDGHLDEVVQRLHCKEDTKSIADWLSSLPDLQVVLRKNSPEFAHMEEAIDNLGRIYGMHVIDEDVVRPRWTHVTSNTSFINHLVKLYLTHVHPHCMLFNELTFLQAYRHGDGSACSRALLNAICAMACNALDRGLLDAERDTSDLAHVQEAFFLEARSLIAPAELQDIVAAQAMAIMYLTDLSRGKARSANYYLKCASEHLRHLESQVELSADFDLSRWGIHCLEATSCALSHQNPSFPQTINRSVMFDSSSQLSQQFSQGRELLLRNPAESYGLSIEIAGFKARLCQLVHGMIGMYGGSAGCVTLDAILAVSKDYAQLLDSASPSLRRPDKSQFGSDVRTAHINFYSMSSGLWSPLVFFARAQRNEKMLDHCRPKLLESARKGLSLIREALWDPSCAFLPPQCTMCVLHICDSVARWTSDADEQLEAIHACFHILKKNTMNFKLCSLLRKLFRDELAKFVNHEIIEEIQKQYEIRAIATIDEALDATTRLTYVTTFPGMSQWIGDNIQWQWSKIWGSPSVSSSSSRMSSSGTQAMRVEDMCN